MSLTALIRRLEERWRSRRLRTPYAVAALGVTAALVLIAAAIATRHHPDPSTPGIVVMFAAMLVVAALIQHLFWRLQRRADVER